MNTNVAQPALRSKTSWIEQIEKSLAAGDYIQAKSLVQNALSQFQDDQDLVALEEEAIQRREKHALVHQLMIEGQELCREKNFEEGLQVLRSAYALDARDSTLRAELVDHLLNHALATIESDLSSAKSSVHEATALDPGNSSVQSLDLRISAIIAQLPKPETTAEKTRRIMADDDPAASAEHRANSAPAELQANAGDRRTSTHAWDGTERRQVSRRKSERSRLRLPIRVRVSSINLEFTEITTTINVSRGGVYFQTTKPYTVGLHVRVTLNFSAASVETNIEQRATVVRVDSDSKSGMKRVALKFMG